MKTVRESTQELLTDVLVTKGGVAQKRAHQLASHIVGMMGLDGEKGDAIGPARCVVLTSSKEITSLYYRPQDVKVVWVQCDDLLSQGHNAVEVF